MSHNKQQYSTKHAKIKTHRKHDLVTLYGIWPGNRVGLFLQPGAIGAKDGGGGDNCSYNTCKAPVKSSPPTK